VVNIDPRHPVRIKRGDRIAQLVVIPVVAVEAQWANELPPSARGTGGFGSTGQ
jgi:dUTP pyrophosphatase